MANKESTYQTLEHDIFQIFGLIIESGDCPSPSTWAPQENFDQRLLMFSSFHFTWASQVPPVAVGILSQNATYSQ